MIHLGTVNFLAFIPSQSVLDRGMKDGEDKKFLMISPQK